MILKTTRAKFPIDGNKNLVAGYQRGPFGLHKDMWGWWIVTHLASGLQIRIAGARLKSIAVRHIDALLAIDVDWYLPDVDAIRASGEFAAAGFPNDKEGLKSAVSKAIKEAAQ